MRYTALVPSGASAPATLARSSAWYAEVSGGAARLEPQMVRVDPMPGGWGRMSRWRWPAEADRAREAATELVGCLPPARRARINPAVLIMVPTTDAHPHTWRFRSGGVHLGGRRWCRSYALVPYHAPLSVVAHELGHLLFGWPDLTSSSGVAFDCLMATGALVPPDRPPAWPCAPLRVSAGWVTPVPLQPSTLVGDLTPGEVRSHGALLVERRDDRVVAFQADPPRVVARAAAADASRPVLAVFSSPLASNRD